MSRGAQALVIVLVVLATLLPGGTRPPPAVGDQHGSLQLEVLGLGPDVLRPDGTLRVRAVVRNTGEEPATGFSVRFMGYSSRLPTREAVHAWATSDYGIRAGDRFLADQRVDRLEPGAMLPVTLEAPAAELDLPRDGDAWGPRGLTVEVLDQDFDQLAVERGFVVWDPRAEAQAPLTTLSLLAPLTAGPPAVDTGLVPPQRIAELTGDGGRLARILEVTESPDVGWVLDPALLAAAAAATAGDPSAAETTGEPTTTEAPTTTGGATAPGPASETGATATEDGGGQEGASGLTGSWAADVVAAGEGRDVLTLPRSDPDLVGLAAAGAGELYGLAARLGRQDAADLLTAPARAEVAWPASGTAGADALALAADSGAAAVLLSAGAHPPAEPVPGTASGRSTVRVGDDRLAGLLVDTSLTTALTGATETPEPAVLRSRLLAETAAISRAADEPVHLLLALPRGWDPHVPAATQTLAALRSAPWLRVAGLRELLDRGPVVPRGEVEGGVAALPVDGLREVGQALGTARRVASALTAPDAVLDAVEASAIAATSVSWRHDLPSWRAAVAEVGAAATALSAGVHVLPGSAVNVVSSQVDLPVTVANELSYEVSAVVSVQPRSSRLVAESDVEVTLPPVSTERVAVPVRALANGNTEVVVTVSTPDGVPLGQPVTVPVRVRADWETRGVLVVGAVLVLVLVLGLARTISRARRADPGERSEPGRPVEATPADHELDQGRRR